MSVNSMTDRDKNAQGLPDTKFSRHLISSTFSGTGAWIGIAVLFICLLSNRTMGQTADVPPIKVVSTTQLEGKDISRKNPPGIRRWIEWTTLNLSTRNKLAEDDRDEHRLTRNSVQYMIQMAGRFKFDRNGRLALSAFVGTGNRFTFTWNDTGIGTGSTITNLYVKQLNLAVKPLNGVEVAIGGLGFIRQMNTEITSYNNNGYMVGERLSIKRPDHLFFDEIHLASGYVGDTRNPSVFSRLDRMGEWNYHFLGVTKKISPGISFSADGTNQSGRYTLRQALRLEFSRQRPFQEVVLENYQRIHPDKTSGFSCHTQTRIGKRLGLWTGFVSIDKDYGPWNSDRFGGGRRFFIVPSLALFRDVTLSLAFTHTLNYPHPVSNRSRLDLVLGYNLLSSLRRAGIL